MDEAPIVGQDVLVEDDDPRVVYSPPGAWEIVLDQLSHIYHGSTYHVTWNESASATLHFNGSRFWYYSDFNSDHGLYTVVIDSESPVIASSFNGSTYRGQQLLFSTALDPGPHTIVITNTDNGRATGVDYFYYRPLRDVSMSTSSRVPDPSPSQSQASQHHDETSTQAGTYIAIVLCAVFGFIGVVALLGHQWRKRKGRGHGHTQPYMRGLVAQNPDTADCHGIKDIKLFLA